ncbi:hypothetical protein UCRNP2_6652 [Neofusicoccum parvum UCRNP2]|uniref:Retrovirus-related Pol polyprotein from transposon TNT 1-94-like beta-barrel domain-containing protein n=1 Tax=Botryosphaeria parva (strain UCR-NP2) TaxID=1287680 RepID=R1EFR7_BOTPV|nr:hypothetical protein UCRNP2_6652 [Neofusicoccum parvum UCRNP2]
MSLQIKTSGLGPTASPKPTPPRQIHRRALSTSSLSSTPSSDAPPPQPQTIPPNRNAWVLTINGKYSMCNNPARFTTLTPIRPVRTSAGTTARGVGTVRLRTRLRNGRVTSLALADVLFVPDHAFSTASLHGLLPRGATFDSSEGGVVRDARRRQLAWFPRSALTTAGLWCLRLVGEWDRLFPADAPPERKPAGMHTLCLVEGKEDDDEEDEEESDEDDGMGAILDWATPEEDREFVRKNWGSRLMFQLSFGLKSSEGIPYAGVRTIGDKDTPGLNRNAWVVLPCWSHSICNDRDKFISYDELIEPIPLHCELGRTAASVVGIGEVRLHLRLRSGQTTECVLANVLHAPGAALNLVTCLNMGDMAGVGACADEDAWCLTLDFGARGNGSELRRKDGSQAAWFPTERKTEAGLSVLRQHGVFDRLWRPPYLPRDSRPRLMLSSWVEGNPWDLLMPVVGGKMLMAEMRKLVTETGSGAEKAATARFRCKPVIGMDGPQEYAVLSGDADPQHPGSKRKGAKKRKSKKRSPEAGPPVEIIGPSLHDFQLEVKGGSQWSKYRFIKVNWWSRPRFQAHYGLSMSPKDLEEGNEILDEYKTFGYFS